MADRIYPKIDVDSVPELEHWMGIPAAGALIGITRQRAWGWAAEKKFKSLHKLSSNGRRPILVVKRGEVEKLAAAYRAEAGEPALVPA